MTPSAAGPAPLGDSLGPYRLVRVLGRGGMGAVWEAVDTRLDRRVALKVVLAREDTTAEDLERFRSEARNAGKLRHPNIVPVHDVGQDAGRDYLVMDLVDGLTLGDALRRRPLAYTEKAGVLEKVARAVQYAHEQGVIHRDLKPSNVMLEYLRGGTSVAVAREPCPKGGLPPEPLLGEPQVMDFGLAKDIERCSGLTLSGQIMGTPGYMPPEQAEGRSREIGPCSDVYALGAILYEMLTGRPPFTGENAMQVLRSVVSDDPVPPSRITPGAPRDLETICLKCLEKRPPRRYASAGALADDLRAWREGEPLSARPAGGLERAAKWVRRHPAAAALAFAAGVLFTGLAVGFFWIRAEQAATARQRDRALAAAAAEQKAKETAEAREAETAAVLDFVENRVFAAARPEGQEGGLGRDVTLRKALAASLPHVEASFAAQPLIEARLRMTLGLSFTYLGEAELAFRQFQAARAIYARQRGPDHRDAILSLILLAGTLDALGRFDEALALNEEALALRKARLGPDHPDTLTSMNNLAISYSNLDRHAEALALHERTLALRKARLGPDHTDTLGSMNNLAGCYHDLGRHAEALALHQETLALMRSRYGRDHPVTLVSMNNLAVGYSALGRHAEALALHEETLALQKAKLGPDHAETLGSMGNLAGLYRELGRSAEALALEEELLARRKARLGPDHPDTLAGMGDLAAGLVALDRGADAVPLIDECVRRAAGRDVPPGLIPGLIRLRLGHFLKTRDVAGCRATAGLWEGLNRADAVSLYNAACWRALIAAFLRAADASPGAAREAEAEADRAMAWLKKAVAAGYDDADHMAGDPDLDVLRGREDFRSLMAGLASRREKAGK